MKFEEIFLKELSSEEVNKLIAKRTTSDFAASRKGPLKNLKPFSRYDAAFN